MEILGHSQIALTVNSYTHVLPELERDAARRMDEAIIGAQPLAGIELGCCSTTALERSNRWFRIQIGSGTGTRTLNLAVNSRLLYRLSYPGTDLEF
jgi:hypothetical protein